MTPETMQQWYSLYRKFHNSRSNYWEPKAYKLLRQDFKTVAASVRDSGINATISNLPSLISIDNWSKLIKNIYIDAGKVYGGKAYQMLKQQQKAMLPIGYNEQLIQAIINYFQLSLLNDAVLPIIQTTRDYILEQLIRAQQQGVQISRIVDSIVNNTEIPRSRARTIARTETAKASQYAALQSVKQLGYSNMTKTWISAQDIRVRRTPRDTSDHLHANGQTVPIDKPFRIYDKDAGGYVDMMQPLDSSSGATAGAIIECRCAVGFEAD